MNRFISMYKAIAVGFALLSLVVMSSIGAHGQAISGNLVCGSGQCKCRSDENRNWNHYDHDD